MDVCIQCSHWTHTTVLLLVRLPEREEDRKSCSTIDCGAEDGNFGAYPARRYKRALAIPGDANSEMNRGH